MSNRIEQLNNLIREELFRIMMKEVEFPPGVLTTLTRVETTVNLVESKVFVSVIPDIKAESVLNILNRNIYKLQQELNKRLDMRPVPKIVFIREKETVKAGEIEETLERLKKDGLVAK